MPEHAAPVRASVTAFPETGCRVMGFVTVTVTRDVLVPFARMLAGLATTATAYWNWLIVVDAACTVDASAAVIVQDPTEVPAV